MSVKQSSSSELRRLLIITLYLAALVSGVVQVTDPYFGGLHFLLLFVMAGAAAWWVISDARVNGSAMVPMLQHLVVLFWPIAVPLYLIATCGVRGLGLSVAHFVGLISTQYIGFYLAFFLVY